MCPAKANTCGLCGKSGHFDKMCRTCPPPKKHVNQLTQHEPDSGFTPGYTVMASRSDLFDDNDELERRYFTGMSHATYAIASSTTRTQDIENHNTAPLRCPRVSVSVLAFSINMVIDSGADTNALSIKAYNSMQYKPVLVPCDNRSYAYGSNKPIDQIGFPQS